MIEVDLANLEAKMRSLQGDTKKIKEDEKKAIQLIKDYGAFNSVLQRSGTSDIQSLKLYYFVGINLVGIPTAVPPGGISIKTTALAPILASSPISRAPKILAPAPILTLAPIFGASRGRSI